MNCAPIKATQNLDVISSVNITKIYMVQYLSICVKFRASDVVQNLVCFGCNNTVVPPLLSRIYLGKERESILLEKLKDVFQIQEFDFPVRRLHEFRNRRRPSEKITKWDDKFYNANKKWSSTYIKQSYQKSSTPFYPRTFRNLFAITMLLVRANDCNISCCRFNLKHAYDPILRKNIWILLKFMNTLVSNNPHILLRTKCSTPEISNSKNNLNWNQSNLQYVRQWAETILILFVRYHYYTPDFPSPTNDSPRCLVSSSFTTTSLALGSRT